MAKQEVNIGVEGNDGTGDSIRESFRKVNENFTELYAVFGQGGQISFTTLSDTPPDTDPTNRTGLEENGSTAAQPVILGTNVGTQGSTIQFYKMVSQGFVTGNDDDNTISFDLTNTDDFGNPVIVVNATKSSVQSDDTPTLGGHLDLAGNYIAANPAPPSAWAEKIEELQERNPTVTLDDILITKGYADTNYLKASGSGTGAQLRVRTEDEIAVEDYTYTIDTFSGGNLVINDRFVNGTLVAGEGHGLDSAANGALFVYGTTGTSAVDQVSGDLLTDTTAFPGGRFYIRVVNSNQLSLHKTQNDALAGTNKISSAGGSGTQTLKDFYYQPDLLEGDFLANEAIPRESTVRRQGDSMEGALYLHDHPGELEGAGTPNGIEDLQAATKFYVDNTSYTSNINFFVSLNGDDTQANTPPGKEGRSLAYAYRTINAACRRAEEIIEASPVEPGPYMQTIEYGVDETSLIPTYVYSGGFDNPADYGSGTEKLELLINENIDFIVAATIGWVSNKIETANANLNLTPDDDDWIWKNFAYNEETCARDLKLIINSAKLDTMSGSQANKLSRQAGLRYFKNASGRLAAITQREQTVATINKALDIIENNIFTNTILNPSYQDDYSQYQDIGLVSPPQDAIDVFSNKFGIITTIINGGFGAAPALREGVPYVIRIYNGGNDSVWQGQQGNTDLIPGKVITGTASGAVGRIVSYDRDQNDGTNTDVIELILEEPIEYLVRGDTRDIQNTEVAPIVGDELEFGNRVSETNITIFVESGIFYEDYPIKIPANVSLKGDEMRRSIVRPRNRVSQSTWANTYFYRDHYFDGIDIHSNTVTYDGEVVLTLNNPISGYVGDVITQTNTFTYNEAKCRRDLEYILTQAGFDITLGTNYNAVTQGLAYQRASGSVVQSSQLSQELASVAFARDEVLELANIADNTTATTRATNYFNEVLDIIENGNQDTEDAADSLVFPIPVGAGDEKVNARDRLQNNRSFIQDEIIAYISNVLSPAVSVQAPTWDADLLRLHVGFWVDALTYDLLYGGDDASTTQARLYFTGGSPTGGTFNQSADQKVVIVNASQHFQSIVQNILTVTTAVNGITRSSGNSSIQNVTGGSATATEATDAIANLTIIENAVSTESDASLGSPTVPSVGWTAVALRDAKQDIENNIVSADANVNIIDLTINFIDNNTGTRATLQENYENATEIVVTYDDGYNPAGPNVAASTPFNFNDEIIINGVTQAGVNVTAINTENSKIYDMGWHYASDSTKPINTNSLSAIGNVGGYVKAAELLKENKRNIQDEVYDWMDLQATNAQNSGFGTWAQVTLVLNGTVSVEKGETLTQAVTGASGKVKDTPTTGGGQTTLTLVSPTAVFNTSNELTGSVSGALGVGSVPNSATVGKFTFTTKCYRDIGYIVDALAYDLEKGRNDQALEVQGRYYAGAVEVGQEEITSQAITRIATVASSLLNIGGAQAPAGSVVTGWKLDLPAAEAGTSGIVSDLISIVTYAFNDEYNPPKHNRDMDVFLMNDSTIIRNMTVQGHGGFMTVLDPDGQILTKSPYIQTGSSFSQSVNKQAFRGGMFVDGFNGNMPIEIVSTKNGDPFRLYARSKRSQVQVNGQGVGHGLFERRPQLPAPFYINGVRYQVNSIVNHSLDDGTCELILDKNSGTKDGNDNGEGWRGPVVSYSLVNGVRTPNFGQQTNYPTILQTAGNRSQLGNDFTQINDLGYGLLVTNTGLSEMVGMFTYYCQAAYYANNGSEIRSVGGSNAYGQFGLVAAGSDPNEVAQTGSLAYNTVQTAKVYRNDSAQKYADAEQNFVYVYDTDFIPLPEGEIDIIFTERQAITSFSSTDTVNIVGHGFEDGQKITISDAAKDPATAGEQAIINAINDDHYVEVINDNSFRLYSDPALSSVRNINFAGVTLDTNGTVYPADGEGTDLRKYEIINVIPAYYEDSIPGVNQNVLTLSSAITANYGDTITQQTTGAIGKVINPQRTYDSNGNLVGGTELIISQADNPASTFNGSDPIQITDVYTGDLTTEYTDAVTITNQDTTSDTSGLQVDHLGNTGLPLVTGNGAVWKITFANQTQSNDTATGGLAFKLYGGEQVTIRQRSKLMLKDVETVPIRPSTAVVFKESSKVYRSLNFDTKPITTFNDTGDQQLPDGFNILTFDTNYSYLLPTVNYVKYKAQVKLTLDVAVDVTEGDVITQGTASGVATESLSGTNVLWLEDWNGTAFTTSGGVLTIDGSASAGTPTEVLDFGASSTFGATAGDTRIALTSGITDPDSLARLQTGAMIFGWKDRVHTVLAYHDGEGNATGSPVGSSLETGFAYLEISATPLVDKNTNSFAAASGLAFPAVIGNETNQVVLSIGVQDTEPAEITVNISLCRATGHDFSNIGTGGFNTSNYPNIIFGEPTNNKAEAYTNSDIAEKAQVWEKGKGRVFVMSTDEDGFFRVGKFFEVDQGTGTVKFAAQINISGLDGLGFRDGETINKFTGDNGMSPIDNSTVPTTYSVQEYLDRRLGFDRNMTIKTAKLGDGFLPQKNPILTQTLDINGNPDHTLNMTSGRIIQMDDPVDDLDATNKQYVDKRVFANDEVQELRDIELNQVDFANDYGKSDLIVLTGNRRLYVKSTTGDPDQWIVGQILTGYATASAAYIEDLEAKTLDNSEEVYILTYKPLQQTVITTSGANNNLPTQRGYTVTQENTGASGEVLWAQGSVGGNGDSKTDGNKIILINVSGTFSTNAADTLNVTDLSLTPITTPSTVYPINVSTPAITDFENERLENPNGDWGQTTGGFDGADVTTTLEFANASEANDTNDHGAPGTTTRSDINIHVTRLRGNPLQTPIPDPGKTEINLQLQDEAIINSDVNTFADIAQVKLDMNNAPVLSNSLSFEDDSVSGQRTKQANQGIAAFDASTFAEDQIWTLTGNIANISVGDILTQNSGTRKAYVSRVITSTKVKVRTADTFVVGSSVNNRLTRIEVTESNYTKETGVATTVTITEILNTGYINIKDRGITFDKIQELPEKTVIGRADIDYDGNDEGAGESGITRAIPFSLIVDEGGALQDKDFSNSSLVNINGTLIETNYEFNAPNGATISQVGNTGATGTVQGEVNTENKVYLINTAGTFNTTGQLTVNGSPLSYTVGPDTRNIIPTAVTGGQSLLGSALVKVSEGQYGTSPISKTGGSDSLVRTYANGDTISGIDSNLNLAGWINVKGLIVDNKRVLDTSSGVLKVYTPGDHLSIDIAGSAPAAGQSDTSTVKIPTASLQVGSTIVSKTAVGGTYNGFASKFQQNAESNNPGASEPYIVSPWIYSNFIQAPDDLGNEGTGIAVGGYSSFTSNDQIALIVKGTSGILAQYAQIDLNTSTENRVSISDGTTIIKNNLNVGSPSKFSVIASSGNTNISGSLTVDGAITMNGGIGVDNTTFNSNALKREGGLFEIEATNSSGNTDGDIHLDARGDNIVFKNDANNRISFDMSATGNQINSTGSLTLDAAAIGSNLYDITLTASKDGVIDVDGVIVLDADGGSIDLKDGGTTFLEFNNTTAGADIYHTEQDKVLRIRGNDNGTAFTALSFDMSDAGTATFNHDVTVEGDLLVKGNIDLGDSATADTMNIEAIIANDKLTIQRNNNDANPVEIVLQHISDDVVAGDTDGHGQFTFYGTNGTQSNHDAVKTTILAKAVNVNAGAERSEIVFATAQGTTATNNRLRISNDIQSHGNINPAYTISSGNYVVESQSLGTSDTYWNSAYVTTGYGAWQGDIKDQDGVVVVDVGTEHINDANPNLGNVTQFYGKFNGPLTGGVDTADSADTIVTGEMSNSAGTYYPTFVADNNASTSRTSETAYTHAGIYYNPATDVLTTTTFSGSLSGNATSATTASYVNNLRNSGGNIQFSIDDLNDGSTNLFFTNSRARGAFSAGTGISITSGTIAINTSDVTANQANKLKVTDTTANANYYMIFSNGTGTDNDIYANSASFSYNPSTTTLTVPYLNGQASSATFADLAERYVADESYEPGTVVVFGGEKELTVTNTKGDRKIAGVISTNPGFLMNKGLEGDTVVELALTGRVPCKVIGRVEKGDMLVTSAIPGYAIVDNDPKLGTVIGKAVEDKDTDGKGVIEVVVGRL